MGTGPELDPGTQPGPEPVPMALFEGTWGWWGHSGQSKSSLIQSGSKSGLV